MLANMWGDVLCEDCFLWEYCTEEEKDFKWLFSTLLASQPLCLQG